MSFQTFVTERLATLTSIINATSTNAKKIEELPAQTTLSGSSLIHVSKDGNSEKISVQQIVNSIVNNDNNQLLSVGEITLLGNDLTIASISSKINNIIQSITTPTTVNIPYCEAGLNRIDLIIYDNTNNIFRITGVETAGAIIAAPTLPVGTLLVTQISVSDSAIENPTPPILGTSFVKKSFANMFEFNGNGTNAIIPLNPDGYSEIKLVNSGLVSISGVDLSLMTGPNFELPYVGKPFIIWNTTGGNVTLKNQDYANADYPFFLREGANIVIPNNHIVAIKWNTDGLHEVNKSFNAVAPDYLLYKRKFSGFRLNTLNTWRSPLSDYASLDNQYFGSYGTGLIPNSNFYIQSSIDGIPTGYKIESIELEISYKLEGSVNSNLQIYIDRVEVPEGYISNTGSNVLNLVNQTLNISPSSINLKYIKSLTVAPNSAPTLAKSYIQIAARETMAANIYYSLCFNIIYKKI